MATLRALLLGPPAWTIAAAESLTAGKVQSLLARASGSSDYFVGGVTAYTLEQKVGILGVDRAHAERVNCVSARVASEMAQGVCRLMGSTVGVATTGYAEAWPAGGVAEAFAYWAVAIRTARGWKRAAGRVSLSGKRRVQAQEAAAKAAVEGAIALLAQLRS